jgi:hypothetical protein
VEWWKGMTSLKCCDGRDRGGSCWIGKVGKSYSGESEQQSDFGLEEGV